MPDKKASEEAAIALAQIEIADVKMRRELLDTARGKIKRSKWELVMIAIYSIAFGSAFIQFYQHKDIDTLFNVILWWVIGAGFESHREKKAQIDALIKLIGEDKLLQGEKK